MTTFLLKLAIVSNKNVVQLLETLYTQFTNIKKAQIYNLTINENIEEKIQIFFKQHGYNFEFYNYNIEVQ
jgi:hypothetical protein